MPLLILGKGKRYKEWRVLMLGNALISESAVSVLFFWPLQCISQLCRCWKICGGLSLFGWKLKKKKDFLRVETVLY